MWMMIAATVWLCQMFHPLHWKMILRAAVAQPLLPTKTTIMRQQQVQAKFKGPRYGRDQTYACCCSCRGHGMGRVWEPVVDLQKEKGQGNDPNFGTEEAGRFDYWCFLLGISSRSEAEWQRFYRWDFILCQVATVATTLVAYWMACPRWRFVQTRLCTMPPSTACDREVNGSRRWTYLKLCQKLVSVKMWSATTLSSALLGREVSGSKHWASSVQCKVLKFSQMLSATMRPWVFV